MQFYQPYQVWDNNEIIIQARIQHGVCEDITNIVGAYSGVWNMWELNQIHAGYLCVSYFKFYKIGSIQYTKNNNIHNYYKNWLWFVNCMF